MNDPVLTNVLIFLVAAFGLLVVAMMALFFRVYVKLQNLQSNLNSEGLKIRKEAQEAAQEVMSQAQLNAQHVIADASVFNANAKDVFDEEMKKATASYAAKYQELLGGISESIQKLYKEVTDSIHFSSQTTTSQFEQTVKDMLGGFQSEIQKEVENLRTNLNAVSDEEKKTLRKEYEKIENQKIAFLEERIVEVVQTVARVSIHKSLTEPEHEKLIIDALKSAQQKGVLVKNE